MWPHEILLMGGIWIVSYSVGVFIDVKAIRTSKREFPTVHSLPFQSEKSRKLALTLGVASTGLFSVALLLLVVSLRRFEISVLSLFVVGALLLAYVRISQKGSGPTRL